MTIITVTPNTVLDQVMVVAAFQKGKALRAVESLAAMGGKPTDASYILGELGIPSRALGFAAGLIGAKITHMLAERGVQVEFTQVNGESRLIVLLIDQSDGTQTTISNDTLDVDASHIDTLKASYTAALAEASVVILGGSLPKGVPPALYSDLITLAKDRRIPVILDAGGAALQAGISAQPDYIKPNREELAGLVGYPIDSVATAHQAGQQVLKQYGVVPIITLREQGGLAVLPQCSYFIPPQQVKVISAAGAGDAVLAGIAASIQRQQPIEEGLRLGFAAATAVLLSPGTANCNREDVERFLPQIELIPYP